jgi:hypothetical protein
LSSVETNAPATEQDEFLARVKKERVKYDTLVAWHLTAHVDAKLSLPWSGDNTYISCSVNKVDDTGNELYGEVDEAKTVEYLARVIKYARRRKFNVEKDYSGDQFTVKVKVPMNGLRVDADPNQYGNYVIVNYYADRNAVCTAKVVGQKVVPAHTTPERVEDVVEWECAKLSFLGVDTEE